VEESLRLLSMFEEMWFRLEEAAQKEYGQYFRRQAALLTGNQIPWEALSEEERINWRRMAVITGNFELSIENDK